MESLPSESRASLVEFRSGNEIALTSPASEFPALFVYQQDEIIKDAVLLSALPCPNPRGYFQRQRQPASCPRMIMKATQPVEYRCSSYSMRSATIGTVWFQEGSSQDIFSGQDTPGIARHVRDEGQG